MFVSKTFHKATVDKHELEKFYLKAQVEVLQKQIEDLKKLIFIPTRELPKDVLEADAIMNVSEKPVEMSEEERTKILESEREADLILTGNYDTDLLN